MASGTIHTNIKIADRALSFTLDHETSGGIYRAENSQSISIAGYIPIAITVKEPWGSIRSDITPYIDSDVVGSETVNVLSATSGSITISLRIVYMKV